MYQYKIPWHLFYSLISINYSRLFNLTSSNNEENYINNIVDNNTNLEQTRNKSLYLNFDDY